MSMANVLENKIALVTGGSRGIGKAIAVALAGAGAHVMITYRSAAAEAQNVVDAIKSTGQKAEAFQSDAAIFTQAKDLIDGIVNKYSRLDILVNNAGITKDGLLMRMSEEDWDAVLDTNLKSVFNLCKAAIRPMMSQRSGKIINITSIAGVIGNAGQTNYASSKAGVIGFTKSLAKELGSRNIQVNAVAPGFVETDMTAKLNDEQRKKLEENIPLKRTAKAEEIASVVKFFASSDADYITGQVLCVDGGMVM
jgi:3-oxoacyl-[acyl-carrier protein] reductase